MGYVVDRRLPQHRQGAGRHGRTPLPPAPRQIATTGLQRHRTKIFLTDKPDGSSKDFLAETGPVSFLVSRLGTERIRVRTRERGP